MLPEEKEVEEAVAELEPFFGFALSTKRLNLYRPNPTPPNQQPSGSNWSDSVCETPTAGPATQRSWRPCVASQANREMMASAATTHTRPPPRLASALDEVWCRRVSPAVPALRCFRLRETNAAEEDSSERAGVLGRGPALGPKSTSVHHQSGRGALGRSGCSKERLGMECGGREQTLASAPPTVMARIGMPLFGGVSSVGRHFALAAVKASPAVKEVRRLARLLR